MTASVVTGAALLGGGSAAASALLVDSCSTSISGAPGQPITLSGTALVAPITSALDSSVLTAPLASQVSGIVGPLQISLGVVPDTSTTIPGSQIASSTTSALQGTALAVASATITTALTSACSIAVTVVSGATAVAGAPAPAPQSAPAAALPQLPTGGGGAPAPGTAAPSGATPRSGGTPQAGGPAPAAGAAPGPSYSGSVDRAQLGDLLAQVSSGTATQYSFGRVPLYSYAGTPYAVPGGAGRAASPASYYGSAVPGYGPQVGTLGAAGSPGSGSQVARASQVEALGGARAPGAIGVVTLLAVLLLSGTSAVVVRTWVLRRTAVPARA